MSTKLTVNERNIISNALGLQAASFMRARNSALAAKDDTLVTHYDTKHAECLSLISRVNNLELF